jgi:hypothetical protein
VCNIIFLDRVYKTYGIFIITGTTIAQVHKELALEEVEDARRGVIYLHDISPNTFLKVGLELEEQQ